MFPESPDSVFRLPAFARDRMLYEVNLRQYSPGGTIREFAAHLPRLSELGAGILWFMPVQPIGKVRRKGSLGSYYSVMDYKAVDPLYGSLDEFRELVSLIHDSGMHVILDWVANHSSWDNVLTSRHPEFYHKDAEGNFVPPFPEWEDVIHLDYRMPGLWAWMIQAMEFWIREADIDGFRCDMANLVDRAFWRSAIAYLNRLKPLFWLAEAEDPLLAGSGFHALYNWNLLHWMNGLVHGRSTAQGLNQMLERDLFSTRTGTSLLNFTSNHDENSWNGSAIERLGIALEACTVLTFILPGMPLVYGGQEAGMAKRLLFFDKDLIPWKDDKMAVLYNRLCSLRKRHPALWAGEEGGATRIIPNDRPSQLTSLLREKNGDRVFSLINFSGEEVTSRLSAYITGPYRETFTEKTIIMAPEASWYLKPWSYHVFEKL